MAPEELAGLHEVAEILSSVVRRNVPKRTASRYTERADFPEPLGRIKAGPVWHRADVERWGHENLPLRPGRPPKAS